MILLNFSHPLTDQHLEKIQELAQATVEEVRTIPVQVDQGQPLESQVSEIVNTINLSSQQWATRPIIINPPGHAIITSVLLAELHGRIGHFPTLVRLHPKHNHLTTYEVAELLNLQTIRDTARTRR
ncbi:MAG TPA: CRISPR-associated protein Csx15 [Ktedonobacteraceae bacterium]|nr:CRISPR-associated protein Csx15 [Ktedonobacteraceae bacterium]